MTLTPVDPSAEQTRAIARGAGELMPPHVSEPATVSEQVSRRNRELATVNAAIAAISGEHDIGEVLQNITDAVRNLIQSRYAALGVADEHGELIRFFTSGLTPDERRAIGPVPRGHGLLGALIRTATPLRVPDIGADSRRSGFPANHPRMKSLLGVPIIFQSRVVGDLYLADKIGADEFSDEDQVLLMVFAGHAAIAIENARLYGEVRAARDQLQARNEELVQQNLHVEEANRLKTEFLANMSHELRTPLNSIIGFAELMYDERVGSVSPDQKEFLGDILTSSRHLLQLINAILDLSKVESGKMEIRPERIDLSELAREVTDNLRTLASNKRITIDASIHSALSDVEADPGRLKQVLYNYLSNAIKFTPEGGAVTLHATPQEPDDYRIEVRDSGIGIQAEEMEKLFVEFTQVDAGASKRYQGTGLGLVLTKRIVEAQGGRVGASSVPGEGSVFFAILPRRAKVVAAGHGAGRSWIEPALP